MKKLINFFKWLFTKKGVKNESTKLEIEEGRFQWNYSKDKRRYIKFQNQPKKKLRVHIREVATEITTMSNASYDENREVLINYYNVYGLNGMHDQILKDFNQQNEK